MDPYLTKTVQQACEEWGPVLERLVKEHGMTASIDARDDHFLLDLASDLQDELRTIRAEQQGADLLRDTPARMKAEGHTKSEIRDASEKVQADADRLRYDVSTILKSPITVRQLERLLAFIRAREAAPE